MTKIMNSKSIIKRVGPDTGKTVAILAGVHGNEKVGILTLYKLIKEIKIDRGVVYFIYANPPAIKKNVRLVKKNLNRLFYVGNKGRAYEDRRAREIMKILDTCDAALDIHSYNSPTGDQFAISERKGHRVLKNMDFPVIVSGFSKLGNGTDDYMSRNEKIGICIECGNTNRAKKFVGLAEKSVYQFLQYFGCIENKASHNRVRQRFLEAEKIIYKKTEDFRFVKKFKDFESLPAGKIFATDGKNSHIASPEEFIIFPRDKVKVGGEVFIIARNITK